MVSDRDYVSASEKEILVMLKTVIPAPLGYELVEPVHDGDVIDGVIYIPIIAWVVEESKDNEGDSFYTTECVCMEITSNSGVVRTPDGRFFALYDQSLDSEEAVITYFKQEADEDKKFKNKKRR